MTGETLGPIRKILDREQLVTVTLTFYAEFEMWAGRVTFKSELDGTYPAFSANAHSLPDVLAQIVSGYSDWRSQNP
jgi:hypothetical protein